MKNFIKANRVIIIAVLVIVALGYNSYSSYIKIQDAKFKIESIREDAQTLVDIAETEAKQRTKIEIIKQQIENAKEYSKETIKERLKWKKIDEAHTWYIRCLEEEWRLELKGEIYDLECKPYYISSTWLYSDTHYKNLERFASYNMGVN